MKKLAETIRKQDLKGNQFLKLRAEVREALRQVTFFKGFTTEQLVADAKRFFKGRNGITMSMGAGDREFAIALLLPYAGIEVQDEVAARLSCIE